jgi:probable HAF family extracellular repeat protein
MAINDAGQAAGASGDCAAFSPILQDNLQPLHALLWEDGKATDLGNLGGTGHGFGIRAENLNNPGQVVGYSDTHGDASFHAFLWTRQTGIHDLGTVGSDVDSLAIGINDAGDVVGASIDASFNPRAFLRVGRELIDLNDLIPAGPLYLFTACSINDRGEIIGIAIDKSSGDVHAYLAVPNHGGYTGASVPLVTPMQGSESTGKPQLQRFGIGGR